MMKSVMDIVKFWVFEVILPIIAGIIAIGAIIYVIG